MPGRGHAQELSSRGTVLRAKVIVAANVMDIRSCAALKTSSEAFARQQRRAEARSWRPERFREDVLLLLGTNGV
jgi:hypothetical protein